MKLKQLFKKRFKFTTVCLLILATSFFWVCYYAEPGNVSFSERGTYDYKVAEDSPIMIWISVDWENGEFWYTDQTGHYYIGGKVEKTGTNHYWFRCYNVENEAIIPEQLMTRHSDNEITLMIGDEIRRFVKSVDQIVTIGNYEYK